MRDRDWLKLAIVEFLGPFALVFAGVGAIIQTQGQDLVAIALAHGLAIGVMISALGHITGGVFNPAVTLGLFVARRLETRRALLYVVAQFLGAIAAAGVLALVYPDLGDLGRNNVGVNLGVPSIGSGFSTTNALMMEIVLTFFLMLAIFGIGIDHRTSRTVTGLVIGLTITLDIFAGGAVSGAAMNPARAFGPAVVQQDFADHWVWWVGPAIGAVIAALLYNDVLLRGTAPPGDETPAENRSREAPDPIPVGQIEPARSNRSRRSRRRR